MTEVCGYAKLLGGPQRSRLCKDYDETNIGVKLFDMDNLCGLFGDIVQMKKGYKIKACP